MGLGLYVSLGRIKTHPRCLAVCDFDSEEYLMLAKKTVSTYELFRYRVVSKESCTVTF